MANDNKEQQLSILKKMQETNFELDMDLDLWHPDRECINLLFSLEGFTVDPNGNHICSFRSKKGTNKIEITAFCDDKDANYLQMKIKQKRGGEKSEN